LKGWNLTSSLSANLHAASDEITLMNNSFPASAGRVDENLHIRIKPSDQLGVRKRALRIAGGGINTPSTRSLWIQYDVTPYQQLINTALKPVIVTEGAKLKVNIEYPATIRIMSVDGRTVSVSEQAQSMQISLIRGIYFISINGQTYKYIHHSI